MSGKCIQDTNLECIKKNFRKCLPKFKFRYAIINRPVQISADTDMKSDTDLDMSKYQTSYIASDSASDSASNMRTTNLWPNIIFDLGYGTLTQTFEMKCLYF